nr:MAG TPA_asm: hypothetical protein [Caudoviricetes sp.]
MLETWIFYNVGNFSTIIIQISQLSASFLQGRSERAPHV